MCRLEKEKFKKYIGLKDLEITPEDIVPPPTLFRAGFSRANIYIENTSQDDRRKFRDFVFNQLKESVRTWRENSREPIEEILDKFCKCISRKWGRILRCNRFKIGIAQKLLNLYLKILWCCDQIPSPPHCPFDSIIIKAINKKELKWTKIDGMVEYVELVNAARKKAGEESIAVWELKYWNKWRAGR